MLGVTFSTGHVGVAFVGTGLVTAFIGVKAVPKEPEEIEVSNMVKFLTTSGLNFYLEELLKNARSKIILISPYIQLQERIKEILKEKKEQGIEIIFVCRKNDLQENISEYSTKIFDSPTLHAKCYMDENEAIVTSLNLYEFSQLKNKEMGFYVKNISSGKQIYKEISIESARLCKNQPPPKPGGLEIGEPKPPNENQINQTLEEGKKYSGNQLDEFFNFDYKGNAGIKKSSTGDIVLFSNANSRYPLIEKGGIIFYQGQDIGHGDQELIFGNKDLYNAYENRNVKIFLFKDYIYSCEYFVSKEPYKEKGKWIFPLSKIARWGAIGDSRIAPHVITLHSRITPSRAALRLPKTYLCPP